MESIINMGDIGNPKDVAAFANQAVATDQPLAELRNLAKQKGHAVESNTIAVVGDNRVSAKSSDVEPTSWYRVYPLDQYDEGKTFNTPDEVRAYLEAL